MSKLERKREESIGAMGLLKYANTFHRQAYLCAIQEMQQPLTLLDLIITMNSKISTSFVCAGAAAEINFWQNTDEHYKHHCNWVAPLEGAFLPALSNLGCPCVLVHLHCHHRPCHFTPTTNFQCYPAPLQHVQARLSISQSANDP